jgi:hypothetical protein
MQKKTMRKRYQPAKLQKIGDILQKVLKRHGVPVRTEDHQLQKIWSEAVGPKIAAYARPDAIKRNVLFVKVANSVWMQQLHFLKQDILEKINRSYENNPVRNIFFSIDEKAAATVKKKDPPAPDRERTPLKARDKKIIEKSLASIKDEDLKDILKRVMTREMTRRRRIESEARRPPVPLSS